MKYKKRAVEVDVIQWDGRNVAEVRDFLGIKSTPFVDRGGNIYFDITIGRLGLVEGTYIVKGKHGNFDACPEVLFKDLYTEIKKKKKEEPAEE